MGLKSDCLLSSGKHSLKISVEELGIDDEICSTIGTTEKSSSTSRTYPKRKCDKFLKMEGMHITIKSVTDVCNIHQLGVVNSASSVVSNVKGIVDVIAEVFGIIKQRRGNKRGRSVDKCTDNISLSS